MRKSITLALSCVLASAGTVSPAFAVKPAETPKKAAADAKPQSEVSIAVKEIITAVRAKQKGGKVTEADLADELKRVDALLARHKGEKTDDVAQAAYLKAQIYIDVLKDNAKGKPILEQVAKDFPDTKAAKAVASRLETMEAKEKLAVGKKFPDFNVTGLDGKPLSVSQYKGKVVLIDFWATWCGPCVAELPKLEKAYAKHKDDGFEIIGISLDSEKDKLTAFLAKHDMKWPQYFDGQGWKNKLAKEYGVNSIPATYLIDGEGTIIGSDLRGEELEAAVAKALKKDAK